jgi:hypothetical protein
MLMLPYLVTIFAVAGLVGQSRAPRRTASRTSSPERCRAGVAASVSEPDPS